MEKDYEFLRLSSRNMIRYSLEELLYVCNDDSKFHELKMLNNTASGKIARKVLATNNIIIMKSSFIFDNFAKLNVEKRTEIERLGIDTFIETYLLNEIQKFAEAV
mgnify:CR=1 FL=1